MIGKTARILLEGRAALVVIDVQASTFIDDSTERSIPNMNGYRHRMALCRRLVGAARAGGVPVILVQAAHRPDLVNFGRELYGSEDVHCLEGDRRTELAVEPLGISETDYTITKRRDSAFFGTDLEILLKGLKAETLLLCGGLTDVCVHYTSVDAHQHDYFCRVVEDCCGGSDIEAHEAAMQPPMEYLQTGARRSLAEVEPALEACQ